MTVIDVDGLRVELAGDGSPIVDEISFTVQAGELVGIVGESGSGKTTIATALSGHFRRGARHAAGSVVVDGTDMGAISSKARQDLRGRVIAYMPQDPTAALNPALRIRRQLEEALTAHRIGSTRAERRQRIRGVLREVALPDTDEFLSRYPHQLSGGQQQRVCIAMAFICQPKVIVLDEPTTGLDVTTQAQVLETVKTLCERHATAAIYVSHDLAVVSNLADRVLVLYAGRMAEFGRRVAVFNSPAHPYTRMLLSAIPDPKERKSTHVRTGRTPAPGEVIDACPFSSRCEFATERCTLSDPPMVEVGVEHAIRCHEHETVAAVPLEAAVSAPRAPDDRADALLSVRDLTASYGADPVLAGVSLDLFSHECLAVVGESGSGKTTLAKSIAGLMPAYDGTVSYRGRELARGARSRSTEERRSLQYIFQSPYRSLNPRKTVGQAIRAPLSHFFGTSEAEANQQVAAALERVALPSEFAQRFPDELSGGERQRVAIARALVTEPDVLICDEITSALDVSVQASIVELLEDLREQEGLALLFVTHNLALVRSIADRVTVLDRGTLIETGAATDVLDRPSEDYTRRLLAHTPTVNADGSAGTVSGGSGGDSGPNGRQVS